MGTVQLVDTVFSIAPFVVVIGVELVSIIAGLLPIGNWNLTVPDRAKLWFRQYNTTQRELLDPNHLQQILEDELDSKYDIPESKLESEAKEIAYSIQTEVPLDENFLERLVEESAALAYDTVRYLFSYLVTTVSLFAVLYSRIVEFSLSPVPVFLMFLGPAGILYILTIYWLQRHIDSINAYALFRNKWPLSPISVALIGLNIIAILSILIVDGCVGPLSLPSISVGDACQVFF